MTDKTNIAWADSTFNPWIGCTHVSPGCDNCYAETLMDKRHGRVQWGAGNPRSRTTEDYWRQPLRWNAKPFVECMACNWRGELGSCQVVKNPAGFHPPIASARVCPSCSQPTLKESRRRVFCASLSDWLDNSVPLEWLLDLLDLIRNTPNLDWLLLTKRIGNWHSRISAAAMLARDDLRYWLCAWLDGRPKNHVWIGATVVSQGEANRDIPKLITTPTAVRFISVEPMLRPLDIRWALPDIKTACCHRCGFRTNRFGGTCPNDGETLREDIGVDWVICGGESGPNARPMHPDWVRSLRDQCSAAGVPFLFKQWGNWAPGECIGQATGTTRAATLTGEVDWSYEHITLKMADELHIDDQPDLYHVSKRRAGRHIDGRTHDEFPASRYNRCRRCGRTDETAHLGGWAAPDLCSSCESGSTPSHQLKAPGDDPECDQARAEVQRRAES